MLNKNWFKHGIAAMVMLVFALLALGSGATTPAVYEFDPSVPLEQQSRLNSPSPCAVTSIDGTSTSWKGPLGNNLGTQGAFNIPAGKHTIVFDYYMNYGDHTVSAYNISRTMNFEPGYEYVLYAYDAHKEVLSEIVKSGPTEWVPLAANESLLSFKRPGIAPTLLRIYIDGNATCDLVAGGATGRVIIPNGKHTLSYTIVSSKTEGEQQGTTEIELTTSSRVAYSIKDKDKTFTKVNTP
jgi:hypothetical protein